MQNKFLNNINQRNKAGFVLLFSVVLTAIILAISLGVSNITLKELNFSTSAQNTNDAFYAADTGAECALYHDLAVTPSQFGLDNVTTLCNGTEVALNVDADGNETTNGPWVFNLTLGGEGRSCVLVTVTKTAGTTNIISRGYNVGYIQNQEETPNCDSSSTNQIERVIEVEY